MAKLKSDAEMIEFGAHSGVGHVAAIDERYSQAIEELRQIAGTQYALHLDATFNFPLRARQLKP
jgi:hypothetical protein